MRSVAGRGARSVARASRRGCGVPRRGAAAARGRGARGRAGLRAAGEALGGADDGDDQAEVLAEGVAAVRREEAADARVPHVALAPDRGGGVGDVRVDLRVGVRVVDALNVHDDLLPFGPLVREVAEGLGRVAVPRRHEAEVVVVLRVLALEFGLRDHDRGPPRGRGGALDELQDAHVDELDLRARDGAGGGGARGGGRGVHVWR